MSVGVLRSGALAFLGILALVVTVMVAVATFRAPEEEQFIRSAGQIEAVARTLRDGDRLGPRPIGGMAFEEVSREHGLVFFQRGLVAGLDPYGYVWSPQGDPAKIVEDVEIPLDSDPVAHAFKHLHGSFYTWKGTH